jgi:DnaJ-class molecular chaperone
MADLCALLLSAILLLLLVVVDADTDYYKLLRIPRHASSKEIKKGSRRKCDNAQRFLAIVRVYEVLSNEDKKSVYDQHGEDGLKQHHYYKVLGISRDASSMEIKKAYFKQLSENRHKAADPLTKSGRAKKRFSSSFVEYTSLTHSVFHRAPCQTRKKCVPGPLMLAGVVLYSKLSI